MEMNHEPNMAPEPATVTAAAPPPIPKEALEAAEAAPAAESEILAAVLAANPSLAAFMKEVAAGGDPAATAARHFGAPPEPEKAEEPEPAMYRSSLEPPGAPKPCPTFLSNISRSFWEEI